MHPGSGRNYHLVYQPPKNEGVDDITGELLYKEDDMPATVKHRLQVYQDETKPLVAYYQSQESKGALKYIAVDGSQPVEKVFKDIEQKFLIGMKILSLDVSEIIHQYLYSMTMR